MPTKKFANTVWNTNKQRWEIYLNPTQPDRGCLNIDETFDEKAEINIVRQLEKKITANKTYEKFAKRDDSNTNAILEGKTETQSDEGGFLPQLSSIPLTAINTMMTALMVYLKAITPSSAAVEQAPTNYIPENTQTNKSTNSSSSSRSLSDTAFAIAFAMTVLITILNILQFRAVNKEKKQKQLYEYQKKLLERLPKISEEIEQKERVIAKLNVFLQQGILKADLTKKLTVIEQFEMSEEDESVDIELGVKKPQEQPTLQDLLISALDETNDLNVYESVEKVLDKLNSSSSDFNNIVLLILFNFLKLIFIQQYTMLTEQQTQELNFKDSLSGFLTCIAKLNFSHTDSVQSQVPVEFVITQLINLLAKPGKLFAMVSIISLLMDADINIDFNVINLESSTFFHIDIVLDNPRFLYPINKLISLPIALSQLLDMQQFRLIDYVRKILSDGFLKKTYGERIEIIINCLMNSDDFRKIVGATTNTANKNSSSSFFETVSVNADQLITHELMELSVMGDDRSLAEHGYDPYYWYSVGDGFQLLRVIRKEKLDDEGQQSVNPGEEFSAFRENKKRIFIADPCVTQNFATALQDDIKTITKGRGNQPKPWSKMPILLLFSVLTSNHWRAIRVQINYEKKSVSILWDDPYGEDHFDGKLKELFLVALKNNIPALFKKNNKKFNESSQITYAQHEKMIDQQGKGNGWDCGVIAFSNIADYAQIGIVNESFVGKKAHKHYSVGRAADQKHKEEIAELRRQHINDCEEIKDNSNVQLFVSEIQDATRNFQQEIIDLIKSNKKLTTDIQCLHSSQREELFEQVQIVKLTHESSYKLTLQNVQEVYESVVKKVESNLVSSQTLSPTQ